MGKNQFPPRVHDEERGLLSCNKCSSLLPYSSFGPDKSSKTGYAYWCRKCVNNNAREHHSLKRSRDPVYIQKRRDGYTRKQFGITLQEYLDKLASQDFKCAICGVELPAQGSFTHLDHDHKTGRLRAFLCTNCNRGLGHFQDSIELLLKASRYLDTHNSNVDTIKEVHVNESSS